jgi:hypothetical protein
MLSKFVHSKKALTVRHLLVDGTPTQPTLIASQPPARIIIIRHGESLANLDESVYASTTASKIPLSAAGIKQSQAAGKQLRELIQG